MTYLDFFPVPMEDAAAVAACFVAGISGLGLAVGFLVAEPRSPTTRAYAVMQIGMACGLVTTFPLVLMHEAGAEPAWLLRFPVFDSIVVWAGGLWLLRLARTAQPTPLAMMGVLACTWIIWLAAPAILLLAALFPVERAMEFVTCLGREQGCGGAGFWIFGIPWAVLIAAIFTGAMILFSQRIDTAERTRVLTIAVALPFLGGVLNLPMGYNAMSMMLGFLVIAAGSIRYYSLQGARAQFLSRFLSPEVAGLVRHRGLDHVMRPKAMEITAVCCDLRGFTRLSQLLASDQVVLLLDEYYDTVGKVVAEFGGTVKDYSGDGVLILVGAPLPVDDHARKGLSLAHRLQGDVHEVIRRWAGPEMSLGMGVGVASRKVSVGAIGTVRLEYTAIGPAVNMAARLCAQARDGEILADARTAELTGESGMEQRGLFAAKGFGDVMHYALVSA